MFGTVRELPHIAGGKLGEALAVAIGCMAASVAVAQERVPAAVVSVYDGDTLTVEATIWPNQVVRTAVRVRGIDTAEIRARCPEEKRLAIAARDRARELVGEQVTLVEVEEGKYAGRVVAGVVTADGRSLGEVLVAEGLARPYDGRSSRETWCARVPPSD